MAAAAEPLKGSIRKRITGELAKIDMRLDPLKGSKHTCSKIAGSETRLAERASPIHDWPYVSQGGSAGERHYNSSSIVASIDACQGCSQVLQASASCAENGSRRNQEGAGAFIEPIIPFLSSETLHAPAFGATHCDRRNQKGAGAYIKCLSILYRLGYLRGAARQSRE